MGGGASKVSRLRTAVSKRDEDEAEKIISSLTPEEQESLNDWKEENGFQLFHVMVDAGMSRIVARLLDEHRTSADLATSRGLPPLHLAALHGHTSVIEVLLSHNADVNATDPEYGNTALHVACINGHEQAVRILLHAMSPLESVSKSSNTPLLCATAKGHASIVKVLCEKGANVEVKDKQGWAAIHWAAVSGHADCVRILLAHHANPYSKVLRGNNSVHMAAFNGHLDVIKVFHSEGVKLHKKNSAGQTPLDLAREGQRREIIAFLKRDAQNQVDGPSLDDSVSSLKSELSDLKTLDLFPTSTPSDVDRFQTWKKLVEETITRYHAADMSELQIVSVVSTDDESDDKVLITKLQDTAAAMAEKLGVDVEKRSVSSQKFERICNQLTAASAVLVVYVSMNLRPRVGELAVSTENVHVCTLPSHQLALKDDAESDHDGELIVEKDWKE